MQINKEGMTELEMCIDKKKQKQLRQLVYQDKTNTRENVFLSRMYKI